MSHFERLVTGLKDASASSALAYFILAKRVKLNTYGNVSTIGVPKLETYSSSSVYNGLYPSKISTELLRTMHCIS